MAENDWDVTKPVNHTKIGDVPQKIRDVKSSAKIIISKEHVTPTTDNAGGQHLKGSARVYLQSGTPTTDPEGSNLDTTATTDDGRLCVNTANSNELTVYIATAAGVSTGHEAVRVNRVKLSENMNANSKNIVSLAEGTQSGQAIHVGQIDTTHVKLSEPSTSGNLILNVNTTFLATAHATGLTLRSKSITTAAMSSVLGNVVCSPLSYAGEESITLPNGLIMKRGYVNRPGSGNNVVVTFDTAFPNSCMVPIITPRNESETVVSYDTSVSDMSKTGFDINNPDESVDGYYWMAIGY